jgi:hypothetical protein
MAVLDGIVAGSGRIHQLRLGKISTAPRFQTRPNWPERGGRGSELQALDQSRRLMGENWPLRFKRPFLLLRILTLHFFHFELDSAPSSKRAPKQ